MLKSRWFVVFAAFALLVVVAGCASQAGSQPSTPEATSAAAESPVATPVVSATSAVTATGDVTGAGTVTGAETVTATETVSGTTTTEPTAMPTVEMPPQSKATQGWAVLWDPELGFEVYYPQGWVVSEGDVTDADAPITRTYTLQPATWQEEWSPVTVEVSQGTLAEFRQKYKEPANGEQRNIGSLTYTYESTGTKDSEERLAIFTSPYDETLRVVIRDVVSASTERSGKYADMGAQAQTIIESFRWRK